MNEQVLPQYPFDSLHVEHHPARVEEESADPNCRY